MDMTSKLSGYLLKIFYLLLILFPLASLSIWLFINNLTVHSLLSSGLIIDPLTHTPDGVANMTEITFTPLAQIFGIAYSWTSLLPKWIGLFVLIKLFRNYQSGIIFSIENTQYYRQLGLLFFFNALIARPLSQMFLVFALTIENPQAHPYLVLRFGTANLSDILIGLMIIIISGIMYQAQVLQEEQKLVI